MNIEVRLSNLDPSRYNPRRVKPTWEAHQRLVASIRAHGLLEPLLICTGEDDRYIVIAGNRRLAALREVHRDDDPSISCIVKEADDLHATEISVVGNFQREPLHPLDEAQAFAELASANGKSAKAIAADLGVSLRYVRQRMKLAWLAPAIKATLRTNTITLETAELFAELPLFEQMTLWRETEGRSRSPEDIRSQVEKEWIPMEYARFPRSAVPGSALMHDHVHVFPRVQRQAFLEAQAQALLTRRDELLEMGWGKVVIVPRECVRERLQQMEEIPSVLDPTDIEALHSIEAERESLEQIGRNERAPDVARRLIELDEEESELYYRAAPDCSEATLTAATVFLSIGADGGIDSYSRLPRAQHTQTTIASAESLPNLNNLSEAQQSELFTQELIAVREALAADRIARKRILVMVLHDRIERDAIMLHRHTHGADAHSRTQGFVSSILDAQRERRNSADIVAQEESVSEVEAYERLCSLTEEGLDALIDTLTLDVLRANTNKPTPFVRKLRETLGVQIRSCWTPDASWLSGYRKAQLAELFGQLNGPTHGPATAPRKKAELISCLAHLFKTAAHSPAQIDDPELVEQLNTWLPQRVMTEPDAIH